MSDCRGPGWLKCQNVVCYVALVAVLAPKNALFGQPLMIMSPIKDIYVHQMHVNTQGCKTSQNSEFVIFGGKNVLGLVRMRCII